MGGCSVDNDLKLVTLVLVGKTGNGKSATGNSILGNKSFVSKRSWSGVTTTSTCKTKRLKDGRMLSVIDTPGMFDSSVDPDYTHKEIVRCVDMAKGGIDAILVVFSICSRFLEEEYAVISSLVTLFGSKVYDYIVIVFTRGDDLEKGESLEKFLFDGPEKLKEIICLCGHRCVLFDNRTKHKAVKSRQVQQLLFYVNKVKNLQEPYTSKMFAEMKFKDEQLKLQKQLDEERDARVKAEEEADKLKTQLDGGCVIL